VAVEKAVFGVPKMYADHHVEAVRNALLKLNGVEDVVASSAAQRVVVRFDPKRVSADAIADALRSAGYAPGEKPALPVVPEAKEDISPWFHVIQRVTKTNIKDLEMSGDFRKY
jgi:copper chaperone CopZ